MSRQKARERVQQIIEIYADAEWDEDLWREVFGPAKCFKCGSEEFEEILDAHLNVVYCCSDCPDYDNHE
jgi:hypothetical protein